MLRLGETLLRTRFERLESRETHSFLSWRIASKFRGWRAEIQRGSAGSRAEFLPRVSLRHSATTNSTAIPPADISRGMRSPNLSAIAPLRGGATVAPMISPAQVASPIAVAEN